MYLLRIILILLAIWLIVAVARRLLRQQRGQIRPKHEVATHSMVRCAHCGLHIPETEAIREGALFFCSAEHRLENQKSV